MAIDRPYQYPDDVKETARQVWGFLAGRSPTKTAAILQRDYDLDVNVRTIQDWTTRYQWAERIVDDVASIAPDIQDQTVIELIFGSYEAAKVLRAAVNSEHPDKNQVAAALGMLDRGGFSPLNRSPKPEVAKPLSSASLDLANATPDELRQHQRTYLDQLRIQRAKRHEDGTSR